SLPGSGRGRPHDVGRLDARRRSDPIRTPPGQGIGAPVLAANPAPPSAWADPPATIDPLVATTTAASGTSEGGRIRDTVAPGGTVTAARPCAPTVPFGPRSVTDTAAGPFPGSCSTSRAAPPDAGSDGST